MTSRFTKSVSLVTAASMLLCAVVCACGGTVLAADAEPTACHAKAPAEKTCCHGKKEPTENEPDHPSPCHGEHSCGHCNAAVTASSDSAKTHVSSPLASDLATPPSDAFAGSEWTTPVPRPSTTGDPSPPGARTLLALHCALNT